MEEPGNAFENAVTMGTCHRQDEIRTGRDLGRQLTCGKVGRITAKALEHERRISMNGMTNDCLYSCTGSREVRQRELRAKCCREALCRR